MTDSQIYVHFGRAIAATASLMILFICGVIHAEHTYVTGEPPRTVEWNPVR